MRFVPGPKDVLIHVTIYRFGRRLPDLLAPEGRRFSDAQNTAFAKCHFEPCTRHGRCSCGRYSGRIRVGSIPVCSLGPTLPGGGGLHPKIASSVIARPLSSLTTRVAATLFSFFLKCCSNGNPHEKRIACEQRSNFTRNLGGLHPWIHLCASKS